MSLTEQRAAYIRPDRQNGERSLVERCQARMIRRKKDTVGAILREFEREIAPLLGPDNGELGDIAATPGPSFADAVGTKYRWDTAQFINLASPYKSDTGVQGGDITSGVIVPAYYPTALSYRLGVTDNAQMQVTLNGGAF